MVLSSDRILYNVNIAVCDIIADFFPVVISGRKYKNFLINYITEIVTVILTEIGK